MKRGGLLLLLAGIAGGALFFSSLSVLWPLPGADLVAPGKEIREKARHFLEERGFDLEGYRSQSMLSLSAQTVDHVEKIVGRETLREWIAGSLPLVYYRVELKKRGEPISYAVRVHPSGKVVAWEKVVPEDHAGARLTEEQARTLALDAVRSGLGLDPAEFGPQSSSSAEQPGLRRHELVFERRLDGREELRERLTVTVAGDEVVRAVRWIRVPDSARRARVSAAAPFIALETAGFAMLAIGALAAFFIFLRGLREGIVKLGRAAVWPGAVFLCLLGTWMLEAPRLFRNWEPLWPQWISNMRYVTLVAIEQSWLVVVLLALVAAGQALDDRAGSGRGASLWRLARGEFLDRSVALASGRGFLVGLICGGVLAGGVLLLQQLAGATTAIQPRGFFFYTLNSAAPAVTSLLFFFGIALAEELGYRFFAGSWMLSLTPRRWVAVAVPAIVYGLTHTRMDFLPPAEPFWARALVLTLVGCVWGWAFLRFDALTVVLSHYTADLFIFNWPRLASGRPDVVAVSLLTVCVPLIPFLLSFATGRLFSRTRS